MGEQPGTFVISLDFELLWGLSGWTDMQIDEYVQNIEGAKNALNRILDLFTKYDIKCTIAFVGGMNNKTLAEFWKNAPALRPRYKNELFSSYESLLPKVGLRYPSDLFFCEEVVSELAENPRVELASHTFSHYYCREEGPTIDEFDADLGAAVANAPKSAVNLKTMIFPRNQVPSAYLDVCSRHGFTHYRGNFESYLYRSEQTPKRYSIRRALRLIDTYLNISGYNCYSSPIKDGNLINVPGSRFLRPYTAALSILEPLKLRRITRSLKYAARHGLIYHLWWHPHNFGRNTDINIGQLERLCQCYSQLRDRHKMQNKWICEL